MLSNLYFRPSTYKTLSMEAIEGIPTLHISVIFPLPMPPKTTVPRSISFKSRNIDLSLTMCREHPLSKCHLKFLPFPTKDICNRNNIIFWYPNIFRSISISTLRHLLLLMDATEIGMSRLATKVTIVRVRL